jgi:hypothetical protein
MKCVRVMGYCRPRGQGKARLRDHWSSLARARRARGDQVGDSLSARLPSSANPSRSTKIRLVHHPLSSSRAQILAVLSLLAVANSRPSGLNATPDTALVWVAL